MYYNPTCTHFFARATTGRAPFAVLEHRPALSRAVPNRPARRRGARRRVRRRHVHLVRAHGGQERPVRARYVARAHRWVRPRLDRARPLAPDARAETRERRTRSSTDASRASRAVARAQAGSSGRRTRSRRCPKRANATPWCAPSTRDARIHRSRAARARNSTTDAARVVPRIRRKTPD